MAFCVSSAISPSSAELAEAAESTNRPLPAVTLACCSNHTKTSCMYTIIFELFTTVSFWLRKKNCQQKLLCLFYNFQNKIIFLNFTLHTQIRIQKQTLISFFGSSCRVSFFRANCLHAIMLFFLALLQKSFRSSKKLKYKIEFTEG